MLVGLSLKSELFQNVPQVCRRDRFEVCRAVNARRLALIISRSIRYVVSCRPVERTNEMNPQ